MDNYNFLADLLATFRASPDFIKALWLVIPPIFMLAVIGLLVWALRLRMRPKPEAAPRQSRALVLDHEDFETQRSVGYAQPETAPLRSRRTITLKDLS